MIPVRTAADYRAARKALHAEIAAAFGRTRSGVRIPHWSVQLVTVLKSEYQADRVTGQWRRGTIRNGRCTNCGWRNA